MKTAIIFILLLFLVIMPTSMWAHSQTLEVCPYSCDDTLREYLTKKGIETIPQDLNLVTNGNFISNITGWDTVSVEGGVWSNGTMLIENVNQTKANFQQVDATTNDVIYVTGQVTKNSGTSALFYILPKNAVSGSIGIIMTTALFDAQTNGTTIRYSGIFTVTNSGYRVVIGRATPTTFSLNFDNCVSINLTQMVALGLIATPTQQAYETWLQSVNTEIDFYLRMFYFGDPPSNWYTRLDVDTKSRPCTYSYEQVGCIDNKTLGTTALSYFTSLFTDPTRVFRETFVQVAKWVVKVTGFNPFIFL